MWIAASARRHGVADEDIEHAWRNQLRVVASDDDNVAFIIGSDRTGRLIELVVRDHDDETVIFHAMPARPKFLR
jgi:hypothetical protein